MPGGRILHDRQQGFGFVAMPGSESVVRALSREQRPRTTDPGSVEGGSIFMLAVTVAVVAIPARSLRKFDREQRVDQRAAYSGCGDHPAHAGQNEPAPARRD